MKRLKSLNHLLETLREGIFTRQDVAIPLKFRRARSEDRQSVLSGSADGWVDVGTDLVWGEPDGYFWFSGQVVVPAHLAGERLYLFIEAQFGSTMGRSDPQCLVRVNGEITQGADGNHRELLLTDNAQSGQCFDIMIEAGTIENRRQSGFGCTLLVHDPKLEAIYYDLRVPLDVATLLDDNDPRRAFLIKAVSDAMDCIDMRPGNKARLHDSLARAQEVIKAVYDAQDFEDKPVITVTGHTHIDVAWLWRIRETRQKMARSMATALSLMEQYPDYRFMYNQGLLLDYLHEDYPELFDRIRDKHKQGQFEIEGALWLEPDANITNGESFIRHIQLGIDYHQRTFGVRPRIMWLPDTFGYAAALPQLMKQSGIDVFITHKMSWNDTNKMPYETFHWQGIDGTKVPAYFLTTQPYTATSIGTTYCPNLKASHVMGTWRRYSQKETSNELFLVYGHGDGGGGPTREMLEHIRRMERGIPGCPAVDHGTMAGFFEKYVQRFRDEPERFPTWVGELYLEFHRGTLTSVAKNKRNNRLAEQALRELEALASYAMVTHGVTYPQDTLQTLWQITLLNQFHDILPGSSIGAVFDDSDADYARFFEMADSLRQSLLEAVTSGGDASADHVLFNPLGWSRSELVTLDRQSPVELCLNDHRVQTQTLHYADGALKQGGLIEAIPALSPTAVKVVESQSAPPDPSGPSDMSDLLVRVDRLENTMLAVSFDKQGRITSIFDKTRERETLLPGAKANHLQAYRDLPPEYDAWDIDGSFEDQIWEIDDLISAEVVETGPHRAAIRFKWRYEASELTQIVALERGSNRVDVDCFIDWHEHNTMVKAAFPLAIATVQSTAEIQFGHVSRPTHRNTSWDQARFESVMHRWVDLSEPDFGVALLNDCKYGYDAKETTLRLTLLRSPTYPWPQADQGAHRMRYAILVHHGLFARGGVSAAAEQFNLPLQLTTVSGLPSEHGVTGIAQAATPLFSLQGEGATIETVKGAQDGEGVILRLWETQGAQNTINLQLPMSARRVQEVDLLEAPQHEIAIGDEGLALTFRPFEIRSFKVLF